MIQNSQSQTHDQFKTNIEMYYIIFCSIIDICKILFLLLYLLFNINLIESQLYCDKH
jgi:hypothetical protein